MKEDILTESVNANLISRRIHVTGKRLLIYNLRYRKLSTYAYDLDLLAMI
jgi:hypothetical protein